MTAPTNVLALPDRRNTFSRERLLRRVRAEFEEMPCLRLTRGQAQRLFGLRSDICERVLATLVRDGALTRGADQRYGLRDGAMWQAAVSRLAARAAS